MSPFTYLRARSIDEAVALLTEHPEARPLAGGMTLLPTLKQRLAAPSHLVDLSFIDGLAAIRIDDGVLEIGAGARHRDVAGSPLVRSASPALARLAAGIGDPMVRCRGTIGGSIANNDPAADYPAALLALGATVVTTARAVAADAFFQGTFATALAADELVVAVRFPAARRAAYSKYRHPASGYAVVGVFAAETDGGARVGVTGAGPCAFRWTAAEARLRAGLEAGALDESVALEAHEFNDDFHFSGTYRRAMVRVHARRAVARALSSPSIEESA